MSIVFAISSFLAVASALLMVTRRNPVYSAVWLLVCFLSFAALYLDLAAPFLAAVHVIVYTGAILVLFVFVIMLLNLKDEELGEEYGAATKTIAALSSTALFALLSWPVWKSGKAGFPEFPAPPADPAQVDPQKTFGTVENVGMLLFNRYGLAFEVVSVLIVVAMFGAMVLAKKKLWTADAVGERGTA